jgi:4-alpha-glucanotransferase
VRLPRSSGIFLHPTSLPEGRLGDDAYRFVDWLEAAGQSWWQVLPLGPPDEFGSPYRTSSAFAGSPGLLADPQARVTAGELEDFVARHSYWSAEWARFAGAGALADQVRFEREWSALRAYGRERGVRLIGDVPIYVSDAGMDVEGWPELFAHGEVAGAPPDALSANGQHWGNPLYDWHAHRITGYRWWIERFRRTFELVDVARLDHFRGFVAYWSVPKDDRVATGGRWRRGPGRALFDVVRGELGALPLIAEDLGVITPAVCRVRDELGLPGMAVLHFLLGGRGDPLAIPENRIAYTGTHDNDTSLGWWRTDDERTRQRTLRAAAAAGIDESEPSWVLVRLALTSRAQVSIVPAQDLLGLGSDARMNTPATVRGNWQWRVEPDQLDDALAARLRDATADAGRLR